MWFIGPPKPSVRTRKRQHDRFVSDLLVCALGRVLDLSASGIRIGVRGRCKLRKGKVIPLTLEAPQGSLTLQAKVVRIVRRGLFVSEVGMEFVGITPRVVRTLKSLAEFGFAADRGIAGSFVGSHEAGDMGGGPRADGQGSAGSAAGPSKLQWAREVLRVDSGASAEEIRAAYRNLARRYHPDAHQSGQKDLDFSELVEAYRTLRDLVHASGD